MIAESFERIHRANLVGMGVLPLEFVSGENTESLGLTGEEIYSIEGLSDDLQPRQRSHRPRAVRPSGEELTFQVVVRIDTPIEVDYYRNGGILHKVIRDML